MGKSGLGASEELSLERALSEMPLCCSNRGTEGTAGDMNFGVRGWGPSGRCPRGHRQRWRRTQGEGPSESFGPPGDGTHTNASSRTGCWRDEGEETNTGA